VTTQNERKDIVITIWKSETLLGKRGIHILLHCKRKKEGRKWYGMVQAGNLKNTKSVGGYRDGPLAC
jgi:hypothetical protein